MPDTPIVLVTMEWLIVHYESASALTCPFADGWPASCAALSGISVHIVVSASQEAGQPSAKGQKHGMASLVVQNHPLR